MAKKSEGADLKEGRIEGDLDPKRDLQEKQGGTQPLKEAQSSAVMEGSCFSEMFFG